MRIHFNGAAQTVTGSQHLLEINGHRLLLECGMYQGRREDTYKVNLNFPFKPSEIDAIILSHAHIDHSGNLPNLVKQGCNAPIYATEPTVELAKIMLLDSGRIQEADAQFVNKKRARKGQPPVDPLYTEEDAEAALAFFREVDYDQPFEPIPGVTVSLVEAGHILGSAAVVLDIEEKGRKVRLWFSGDIGRPPLPLMRDPVLPQNADYLMMECTYGDKPHRHPEEAYIEFRQVMQRTIARGGKVIIPAFSVGRTQELVFFLNRMHAEEAIPPIPVYVDSPLAVNATDIYRKYACLFDEETRAFVESGKHPALNFPSLVYTRSVDESKAINEKKGPLVIISASGMAENGRILHHLRNNIEDPKNTILIVSWQAPHTLGRRLAERQRNVRIFGEEFTCRAEIQTIGGLSAHAGQDFLTQYALAAKASAREIYLVHGEPAAAGIFQDKLREVGIANITYPELNERVEI